MNTANLQLEGLVTVLAAVLKALERQGALSAGALQAALRETESALARDETTLSRSNREAVLFPVRYLRVALSADGTEPLPSFRSVAAAVGRGGEGTSVERDGFSDAGL